MIIEIQKNATLERASASVALSDIIFRSVPSKCHALISRYHFFRLPDSPVLA